MQTLHLPPQGTLSFVISTGRTKHNYGANLVYANYS